MSRMESNHAEETIEFTEENDTFSLPENAGRGLNRGTGGQSMGQNAESLAEVAKVWDELPEALRAGILAMVRAAEVKA